MVRNKWSQGALQIGLLLHAIRSFYCMFLFAFLSTLSRQPAGRFTPNFACGRTLVPDVSSLLLGVSGPREAGKRGNVECEWRVCVSSTDALVIIISNVQNVIRIFFVDGGWVTKARRPTDSAARRLWFVLLRGVTLCFVGLRATPQLLFM